jgi:hypothetical protein
MGGGEVEVRAGAPAARGPSAQRAFALARSFARPNRGGLSSRRHRQRWQTRRPERATRSARDAHAGRARAASLARGTAGSRSFFAATKCEWRGEAGARLPFPLPSLPRPARARPSTPSPASPPARDRSHSWPSQSPPHASLPLPPSPLLLPPPFSLTLTSGSGSGEHRIRRSIWASRVAVWAASGGGGGAAMVAGGGGPYRLTGARARRGRGRGGGRAAARAAEREEMERRPFCVSQRARARAGDRLPARAHGATRGDATRGRACGEEARDGHAWADRWECARPLWSAPLFFSFFSFFRFSGVLKERRRRKSRPKNQLEQKKELAGFAPLARPAMSDRRCVPRARERQRASLQHPARPGRQATRRVPRRERDMHSAHRPASRPSLPLLPPSRRRSRSRSRSPPSRPPRAGGGLDDGGLAFQTSKGVAPVKTFEEMGLRVRRKERESNRKNTRPPAPAPPTRARSHLFFLTKKTGRPPPRHLRLRL